MKKKHFEAVRTVAGAASARTRKARKTYRKYSRRLRTAKRLWKAIKKLL